MKQLIITAILICLAVGTKAQPSAMPPKEDNVEIADFISDLSKAQKSKIDLITKRSTKIIDNYRQQLHNVRDSIRTFMDLPNDNSPILFPLYEREGRLQTEISKEYYRCKLAIDKVLTPEQQRALKEKMGKNRQSKHKKGTPAAGPNKQQARK